MIRLDDRRGSGEFHSLLTRLGAPAYVLRQEFADFSFTGYGPDDARLKVGIERKTTDEILAAVTDKRKRLVDHQLPGLVIHYPHRYLLVEGHLGVDAQSGVLMRGSKAAGYGSATYHFDRVARHLTTLQLLGGLRLLTTRNRIETAYTVRALYGWYQKRWDEHRSHLMMDKTTGPGGPRLDLFRADESLLEARTVKRRVANQLPGVSWKRSGQADRYFHSIVEMVTASVAQWQAALGIEKGTKLAEAIRDACFRTMEE